MIVRVHYWLKYAVAGSPVVVFEDSLDEAIRACRFSPEGVPDSAESRIVDAEVDAQFDICIKRTETFLPGSQL